MNGSAPHDQVRGVGSTINHQLRRPIDLCCVTHDHYDHLDRNSVLQLKDHVDVWITPLAVGDWLVEKCGIDRHRIVQLEWWEQIHLRKKQNGVEESPVEIVTQRCMENQHGGDGYSHRIIDGTESAKKEDIDGGGDSYKDLTITCCPASHWASRTLWDRNRRLWCSFALKTASYNFFACGDTSYPESFPLFRQIGDALGPFDLAALPIGAYGTRRQ
jgi:N-acyl-phosphatidylethanolamine-hydrolysing phospholipase D